jgi:hypothetical protein
MTEILKPFGVGQYQSSIGFCDFAPARLGAVFVVFFAFFTFFADRFTARFISISLAGPNGRHT